MSDTIPSLEKKQPESPNDSTSAETPSAVKSAPDEIEPESQTNSAPDKNILGAAAHETSEAIGVRQPIPEAARDSGEHESEIPDSDEKEDYPPASSSKNTEQEESHSLGRFNACFDGLSKIGPLALLVALLCMAWPIFWEPGKGVYCPSEIRGLTAFLHCVATGSWYAPTGLENGAWTIAQWPVFTWCTGLLALSPSLVASGYLLPTTSFICTFFAVLGVWCLACAAGFGYRAAFAAGLILLCTPIFAPLPNFVGPATVAAGFFLFALVFFCRGWRHNASWFSLPTAFVLTALAGLAGGWLLLIVPLLASFCFLVWQGTLRRSRRGDAIFGYILMLAIIGCWIVAVSMDSANDTYLDRLFDASWRTDWASNSKWFLPAVAGVLGTMPWLLMILGVSWGRVCSQAGKTLFASRHSNASALVWISLTLALPIAFFIPWFHPAAVTIACLVCVLLGKAAIKLGSAGNRFFYLLASLCLILAGLIILCLSFEATQSLVLGLLPSLSVPDLGQKLLALSTLPYIGAIVLLGGIIALMFVKHFSGSGPLIYGICLVIILCQPARLALVGELAAMPGTPLVPFTTIQAQVDQALAPAPVLPETEQPATPATPEPQSPIPVSPPVEEPQQITPELPRFQAPEAPILQAPPAPESAAPQPGAESREVGPQPPVESLPTPEEETAPNIAPDQAASPSVEDSRAEAAVPPEASTPEAQQELNPAGKDIGVHDESER